jgi:xanthine dehydrogenase large subunit
VWNDAGKLTTHAPSTYKIPATGCIPAHFKVALWPQANREDNIYGSKAVGEPPFMLAISVWEALRDAVAQAGGNACALHAPCTAEHIYNALQSKPS